MDSLIEYFSNTLESSVAEVKGLGRAAFTEAVWEALELMLDFLGFPGHLVRLLLALTGGMIRILLCSARVHMSCWLGCSEPLSQGRSGQLS